MLDIKLGKYTLDQVLEYADELENDMKGLKETSDLPDVPDYSKVNSLLKDLTLDFYTKKYQGN